MVWELVVLKTLILISVCEAFILCLSLQLLLKNLKWPYVFYMITRQFGGFCKKCSLRPEVQTCWLWTSVWTCYRGKNGLCTDSVKGMIFVLFVMWMSISCPCPKESENEWGSQISVTTFSQSGSNMKVYHSCTVIWMCSCQCVDLLQIRDAKYVWILLPQRTGRISIYHPNLLHNPGAIRNLWH